MLREQNIFLLYPNRARPFPCNQRAGCGLSSPFSSAFPPSCPAPASGQNTAFNRSLVYRGTLTLHLLIASVMAFLGFNANLLGRPCDFGKSSHEYLISPYSGYIIAGVHARTRSHARERVDMNVDSLVAPAIIQKSSNIFGSLHGITSGEISLSPRIRRKNERGAIILPSNAPFNRMAVIRRGRLKIGVAARTPNASSIRIDYRIYYDHELVISQFAPLDN